ncbi:ABC transporter substrate-binding protein [Escherichia coli]|nr:ABC transporter substrate-binding protein [Escherichia coli]
MAHLSLPKPVKLSFERLLKIGQGPAEAFPKDLKIDAPDEHTVKFTLSQPFAPFLYTLANDGASIINPAVLKEHAADDARGFLAQNTAGSGPFMLKKLAKRSAISSGAKSALPRQ